jgi:AcrR family transcriptional regulator
MNRERGRPRQFDEDEALDRARDVFWRHGFQSASLSNLIDAMGINKPSMYATFGDKQALYLKALKHYAEHELAERARILDEEPDGRTAVAGFLRAMAALLTDPSRPGGCFVINGTADVGCPMTPTAVEHALQNVLQGSEAKLRERLLRAQHEGQLPATIDAKELAGVFSSLLAGMAVLAKCGAKRAKLNAIISTALKIWPY